MTDHEQRIVAICGKGGVGKTALASLLARELLDYGIKPLLLIDADPVGGLTAAIGQGQVPTLGGVRAELIARARGADQQQKARLATDLDYLLLQTLVERDDYSLLAMGHSGEKGCYCSVNSLLRDAVDLLVHPFAAVLIDAEAGIEQINRQVTRRVSQVIAVTDGSTRGGRTLALIKSLLPQASVGVVLNRAGAYPPVNWPGELPLLGTIPEDPTLSRFDQAGRPLWELPADAPARQAVRQLVATVWPHH